jgi:DNA-binding HxlR family transcriptional regulator
MNEVDNAILEFYSEIDRTEEFRVSLPPTAVWQNLVEELNLVDRSSKTISRRMTRLEKMGLLKKTDEKRGYYRFTDKGEAYLAGNLGAEDLELPDE